MYASQFIGITVSKNLMKFQVIFLGYFVTIVFEVSLSDTGIQVSNIMLSQFRVNTLLPGNLNTINIKSSSVYFPRNNILSDMVFGHKCSHGTMQN